MRDPKGLWHRRAAPWFDLALAAAATTGVTAVVLWISAERGRLSMPPKFDDVSYMIDGLRRLHELQRGGLAALVHDLISRPPHSPYSTAAALLGYLTFGLHDYAPYVVNTVVLLIFFRFVLHLSRGMTPLLRTCLVAGVLPIPLVSLAINEFRPDFFSAELVMIGAMLLVAEPVVGAGPRRHLLIGAAFAGAILAKPTAFPATLAIFLLSGFWPRQRTWPSNARGERSSWYGRAPWRFQHSCSSPGPTSCSMRRRRWVTSDSTLRGRAARCGRT
jgi:hypothetical protein